MAVPLKHFWLLRSEVFEKVVNRLQNKKKFEPIKLGKGKGEISLEFEKSVIKDIIKSGVKVKGSGIQKRLCKEISNLVKICSNYLTQRKKYSSLPLWFVKLVALLIACDFDVQLSKKYVKKVHEKEIESKNSEIYDLDMDNIEESYFSILLLIEERIKKIYVNNRVLNPFPIDLNSDKKPWLEFIYCFLRGGHLRETEVWFTYKRMGECFNNCVKAIFGVSSNNVVNKKYPKIIKIILEDCFIKDGIISKKVPPELKKASPEVQKRFLSIAFDWNGSSSIWIKYASGYCIQLLFSCSKKSITEGVKEICSNFLKSHTTFSVKTRAYIVLNRKYADRIIHCLEKRGDLIEDLAFTKESLSEKLSTRTIGERWFYEFAELVKRYILSENGITNISSERMEHVDIDDELFNLLKIDEIKKNVNIRWGGKKGSRIYKFSYRYIRDIKRFRDEIGFNVIKKQSRLCANLDVINEIKGKVIKRIELDKLIAEKTAEYEEELSRAEEYTKAIEGIEVYPEEAEPIPTQ